jgi:hypothetical protein
LSEYCVPDDDMSDSLPADGGPDPYDGWDLERVLSGENVRLPEGMRPVAETLAALRAAPMRAELADEASARAAFREIMLVGDSGPARPVGGADGARTLILPTRVPDGGPRAVTRPRHAHRRPRRRGRWQPKALAAAAAAAVIVGGIALAGTFSGVGGHPGHLDRSSGAASATPESRPSNSNGLEGTATKAPTPHPTPSHSAGQQTASGSGTESEARALCDQYLAFIMHPSRSGWAAESDNARQLSNLAGGSGRIVGYCVGLEKPWAMTPKGPGSHSTGPGLPPPGDSAGSAGFGGPQDPQGQSRLKDQDVGNGQGGNSSGPGGQGQQ